MRSPPLSDDLNLRQAHRHGRAWLVSDTHDEPPVSPEERDPRAMRWLCLALGAFWVGLVAWVVA